MFQNDGEYPNFLAIDLHYERRKRRSKSAVNRSLISAVVRLSVAFSRKYRECLTSLTVISFFNRLTADTYVEEMREFLLETKTLENAILFRTLLQRSKNLSRLLAITQIWFGIESACLTKVKQKVGKFITRRRQKILINRIYNRVIFLTI
jgi:hypothetical protein